MTFPRPADEALVWGLVEITTSGLNIGKDEDPAVTIGKLVMEVSTLRHKLKVIQAVINNE